MNVELEYKDEGQYYPYDLDDDIDTIILEINKYAFLIILENIPIVKLLVNILSNNYSAWKRSYI